MLFFKLIEFDTGKVLLNQNAQNGSYVLGTYDGDGHSDMVEISPKDLRDLAHYILDNVPESVDLWDAVFIRVTDKDTGVTESFAYSDADGLWHSTGGYECSTDHLLEDFNIEEIIF